MEGIETSVKSLSERFADDISTTNEREKKETLSVMMMMEAAGQL